MPYLGKGYEDLCAIVDALKCTRRGVGIIGCYILEDIFEPALSFRSSRYFCHERIRRAMSSFEITRFASESVNPRSTMT